MLYEKSVPCAQVTWGSVVTDPPNVSEECAMNMSALVYNASEPVMERRFSNLPGVASSLPGNGLPECAPAYAPLFDYLTGKGYTPG